jgi:hypothetical protein
VRACVRVRVCVSVCVRVCVRARFLKHRELCILHPFLHFLQLLLLSQGIVSVLLSILLFSFMLPPLPHFSSVAKLGLVPRVLVTAILTLLSVANVKSRICPVIQ